MSAQSEKALLASAGMLADSARNLEFVIDKLESISEQQAAVLDRLSDKLDSIGATTSKASGGFGSGVKGFGSGAKNLAEGLSEISKILPALIKGLIGFNMVKSNTFVGFVKGLTEAIGKQSKDVKTQYTDFSIAFSSISSGLSKLSMGLFLFDKMTTEDSNNRFIEFINDLSKNIGKIKTKKVKDGSDAIDSMSKSIALFGLTIALSTPVYAIAAVGSLVIVPIIVGYAYLFSQLGETEVNEAVDTGAKTLLWMGLGLTAFAIGLFAVKELAGGSWGDFIKGSLIVMAGAAAFALFFDLIGGKEFSERVERGSKSLIFTGVAIASLALGIWAFQELNVNASSILTAGLAIITIGAAFGLVGIFHKSISNGAESLILSGVAIASIGLGLWVFQKMDIGIESIFVAGLAIAVVGLAFGLAGEFAGEIVLGALSLLGASIAIIAIGFGFSMFKKNKIELDDIGLVSGVLLAVGTAMAAAGLASLFIIPGAAAMALSGLALYSVAKGLNVFKSVKFGEEDADKLNYVLQSISSSFALAGGTAGMSNLFGINIGRNAVERGVDSVMYAGDALTNITKGLLAFKNLGITEDEMQKLWNSISFVVTGISSAFSIMGGDPGQRSGLLGLIGIEKPTNVERGISSVKDIGSTLVDLAEGVKAFANLTFVDPITKKTVKMTPADIEMVGTNISMILNVVSNAFGKIGAGSKDAGGLLGLFGAKDNNVAMGISAVKGVGKELVNIADGIRGFANMSFKDAFGKVVKISPQDLKYDPKNPAKSGSIMRNIVNVVTAISQIFGDIGSKKGESTGFWGMFGAKSNSVAEGIEAVKGVGTELKKIADSIQVFSKIENIDKIKANVFSVVTSLPAAFVVAYTKYISKLPAGWTDAFKPFNEALMGFVNAVKDAPADMDKKGNGVTSFIERIAKSADPITKLSNSFDRIAKSMDRFTASLRKMSPDAVKTSDMLIQSLVTFSKVDPNAFDKNTAKGRELINFIYERKPAVEEKPAAQPTPSNVVHTEPGKTPVKTAPKEDKASAAAAQQLNTQLMQMMTDMTTNMAGMANALKDIKMILQGTLKVQQVL